MPDIPEDQGIFHIQLELEPDANGDLEAALEKAIQAMQGGLDGAGLAGSIELLEKG